MNWSDERYVKFYVRNTATWVTWPWQARACLALFLKSAEGTGLLDCGKREPLRALAALTMMPFDVVETAVSAMVETGTLEPVERGWLIPNYLEAQEATKTPAAKKRDQRHRDRAKAREIVEQPVTESHQVSPAVTECPPPTTSPTTNHQPNHQPPAIDGAPRLDPVAEVAAAWNALPTPPFPRVTKLTTKRRAVAAARLREVPDVERWRRAVATLPKSPFLRGENDRGWVANWDWLMRPDTLAKLEEGNYRVSPARGFVEPQIHGEGPIVVVTSETF